MTSYRHAAMNSWIRRPPCLHLSQSEGLSRSPLIPPNGMSILRLLEEEAAKNPYQLLTCTRYDTYLQRQEWNNDTDGPSPFFFLPLHFNRLVSAAEIHNWFYARSSLKYGQLKSACMDAIYEQRIRGKTANAFKVTISEAQRAPDA